MALWCLQTGTVNKNVVCSSVLLFPWLAALHAWQFPHPPHHFMYVSEICCYFFFYFMTPIIATTCESGDSSSDGT